MNKNPGVRNALHKIGRRANLFFSILLLAVLGVLIWIVAQPGAEVARIALTISLITTVFAAISAFASLAQTVELQRQRENLERPYLQAFFEHENSGLLVFRIINAGNSPAFDAKIEFDPVPTDYDGRPLSEVSLFSNPITFIPPGKSYRQIVIQGHRFFDDERPTKYTVKASYSEVNGDRHVESFVHDLAYLKEAHNPPMETQDYLKELTNSHSKLEREVAQIRTALNNWNRRD